MFLPMKEISFVCVFNLRYCIVISEEPKIHFLCFCDKMRDSVYQKGLEVETLPNSTLKQGLCCVYGAW